MQHLTGTRIASCCFNLCMSVFFCVALAITGGSNALAQSTDACIDSDGDGWGWDGSQTCLVTTQSPAASSAASEALSATESCDDPDGDGWGWDGSQTCIASSSSSGSPSDSSGASGQTGSACVDDDGDGWGWNGVESCEVGTNQESTASESADSGASVPVAPAVVPQSGGQAQSNGQVSLGGQYNRNRDLIALHFDFAPDPDDAHAAAAARVVQDQLGLAVQVVAGTYGVWSADRYDSRSVGVMNAMWGGNWLDAHNNRSSSVEQAMNRWVGTMAAGGDVWIAEGGPSDFSAMVVERINQQFPEFNTRNRIHLVQHSVWNEDHSLASRLDYVRANTRYIKIEDGNEPNSTADFREASQSFVNQATSSQYAGVWNAAFAYLSPGEKLDFSDAVELMHILGINRNQIANAEDFARVFLN